HQARLTASGAEPMPGEHRLKMLLMKESRFGHPSTSRSERRTQVCLAFAIAAAVAAPAFAGGAPPTLTKSFSPTSIGSGAATVLTFTVTSPAGSPAVSNIGFTDTLPPGLRVGNPPSVGGTCANAAAATV